MLRELAEEGRIERRRKRLHHAGTLPPGRARRHHRPRYRRRASWRGRPNGTRQAHGAAPVIHIVAPRRARPGEAAGVGDRALSASSKTGDEETSGRVIKLIDRAKHRVLGIFRGLPGGGGRLVPIDKKQLGRELAIAADADRGRGRRRSRRRRGRAPRPARPAGGTVVERLGSIKSERAVSLIAIHAHDIPHVFPRAVLDEAERRTPGVARRPRGLARRCPSSPSIRPTPRIMTTRSTPSPDHRPAQSAAAIIVSVAIADVAHYVRPGSALDREAARRGNSVYFPDRVVPMLPERISNDLCSLRPSEDRPALAVRMVIGADGRKRSHTFHRVLIRSAARLHYEQAQLAVSGRPDEATEPDRRSTILEPLYAAYEAVRRARDERGPLDLDIPERKIVLKSDGTVDRVIMPQRLESHRLIEEFMILANVAAAETCERARVPLIYRVHDEPTPEKLNALREFLATLDISLPKGGALRPDAFNRILARVKGRDVETAGQRGRAAHARRRPNIRRRITAISASICAATRISPRRSAAMPIWSCTAP